VKGIENYFYKIKKPISRSYSFQAKEKKQLERLFTLV